MKMSTKFTCRFCKEQFDVPKGLYKHLQSVHNAGASRDNRTCPICGVLCSKYEGYRDHLLYIHGQTDDGQKLTFKSLNEFLVWKTELELKHNCKYVLQTSPKVLPSKEKKYFYQCDLSSSKSKEKKSSVVMKTCTSVISVVEGTGAFKVEYWDTHSGHSEVPSSVSVQRELEAAINSVEMVNSLADNDNSYDRSEEVLASEDPASSVLNVDKQRIFTKTNSNVGVNNSPFAQKTKTMQVLGKFDGTKKKSANTSILYSLASVACGKGLTKKAANKVKENEIADAESSPCPGLEITSKNVDEKSDKSSDNASEKKNENVESLEALSVPKSASKETKIRPKSAATSMSSILLTNKTSSSKLSSTSKISTSNSVNSLITSNSAFSNQLVIMNPVGMEQSSMNSNQNVFNSGQNILLSLAPIGQNVVPANTTTPQTGNQVTVDTKTMSGSNSKVTKGESSKGNSLTGTQSTSNGTLNSMASTITTNSAITLTSGLSNAPVILSSLPVGSTFMSVNNNLIPIASPSGAFIPTSLPPNIVLTPVAPSTTLPNVDSSIKSVSATQNIQPRLTTPSSIAITVSSIVKEPVYTSSVVKHVSNIVASGTSPVPSISTAKSSKPKTQSKFVPIAIGGKFSPNKNLNKSIGSPKGTLNLSASKNLANSVTNKTRANNIENSSGISNRNSPGVSPVSTLKTSARKRISRGIKLKCDASPVLNTAKTNAIASTVSTKVVNSQLNLAPISSTSDVTGTPQIDVNKPGTLLFESSGDIYMLEPIENEAEAWTPLKTVSAQKSKIKIDRAMQTNESSNLGAPKSKLQRKRAAPPSDDSAVMLKVKLYQLEMKYLNSQTECKRLKVELTKEKLKNAELTGKKASVNLEEETENESGKTSAAEIMKEIEDKYSENKDVNVYTMTKTSVLRSLYEDLEELCVENGELYKELENYRAHDKFYKTLKKRLYDEEF